MTAATDAATALADGFLAGLGTIVDGVTDVAIAIYDAFALAINTYFLEPIDNILSFTIEDPTGFTGGVSFDPDIPRLATGGVTGINDPFMAIIGDNKTQREIVTPEDLMRDIVNEEFAKILMSNNMQEGQIAGASKSTTYDIDFNGPDSAELFSRFEAKIELDKALEDF